MRNYVSREIKNERNPQQNEPSNADVAIESEHNNNNNNNNSNNNNNNDDDNNNKNINVGSTNMQYG